MADGSEKATESDESYARLHQAILSGQLLPNERLVELDLAKTYGVGRAAIRMALARLDQEGLVEREPNRGARVRAISSDEAIEMLEARAVLEGLVARHAALKATEQDIAELRGLERAMAERLAGDDLMGFSDLNTRLHGQLLRLAGHTTATRLLDRLRAQNVLYQYRMVLVPGRAAQSLDEHRTIIDAIAAHDGATAESAMRSHLMHAVESLRRTLQRDSHSLLSLV